MILTGGTGRRLGGADKARLVVDGVRLVDRALAAVAGASEVVVVGPPLEGVEARFVRESPEYGGPAAGVAAGLRAAGADLVAVVAVDLPHVTAATVRRLLEAVGTGDGSVLVDADGRRALALVVRRAALAAHLPDDPTGLPLWRLLAPLDLTEVAARDDEADDVDTWEDLRR